MWPASNSRRTFFLDALHKYHIKFVYLKTSSFIACSIFRFKSRYFENFSFGAFLFFFGALFLIITSNMVNGTFASVHLKKREKLQMNRAPTGCGSHYCFYFENFKIKFLFQIDLDMEKEPTQQVSMQMDWNENYFC